MIFRGASPRRTPLHALSRAATPARAVRVIALAALVRLLSAYEINAEYRI